MHRWNWDAVYYDIDGTLTGQPNGVVVSSNNLTTTDSRCQADSAFDNGVKCFNTKGWIRMSWNDMNPEFVALINVTNSQNNMATSPRLRKRLTHKFGYMAALEANQEYFFALDESFSPTNITYTVGFYEFQPDEYLIIKHRLAKKPDRVTYGSNLFTGAEVLVPLSSNNSDGDWYWDESNYILSYFLSNNRRQKPYLDIPISFSAIKCRYAGCVPPDNTQLKPAVTGRPADALYWSNLTTWTKINPNYTTLPRDYANVIIPYPLYVVLDVENVKTTTLTIEGTLEFENSMNHTLEADMIFINGGQMIVGWENDPILNNVKFVFSYVFFFPI